jgi:hypothetical protein
MPNLNRVGCPRWREFTIRTYQKNNQNHNICPMKSVNHLIALDDPGWRGFAIRAFITFIAMIMAAKLEISIFAV